MMKIATLLCAAATVACIAASGPAWAACGSNCYFDRDGNQVIQNPVGTTIVQNPDFSTTTISEGGEKTIEYFNGNTVTYHANGGATYRDGNGNLVAMVRPDGRTAVIDKATFENFSGTGPVGQDQSGPGDQTGGRLGR